MKLLTAAILVLLALGAAAQDKICLLNGECLNGKVREVGTELVLYTADNDNHSLDRRDILLIEFSNGLVEIVNSPAENLVYSPDGTRNKRQRDNQQRLSKDNLISLNSLALCNADVSLFYERLFLERKLGLGGMGAYNFNSRAGLLNNFISILNGGKKEFDLGLTANYYFNGIGTENTKYFGILFKYSEFSFYKTIEDRLPASGGGTSINIRYTPSRGSQLATIFTFGTVRAITDNFFIRTMYGFGGFNMHGSYREEYNYQQRALDPTNRNPVNYRFRPKLYFGVNATLSF